MSGFSKEEITKVVSSFLHPLAAMSFLKKLHLQRGLVPNYRNYIGIEFQGIEDAIPNHIKFFDFAT